MQECKTVAQIADKETFILAFTHLSRHLTTGVDRPNFLPAELLSNVIVGIWVMWMTLNEIQFQLRSTCQLESTEKREKQISTG